MLDFMDKTNDKTNMSTFLHIRGQNNLFPSFRDTYVSELQFQGQNWAFKLNITMKHLGRMLVITETQHCFNFYC